MGTKTKSQVDFWTTGQVDHVKSRDRKRRLRKSVNREKRPKDRKEKDYEWDRNTECVALER